MRLWLGTRSLTVLGWSALATGFVTAVVAGLDARVPLPNIGLAVLWLVIWTLGARLWLRLARLDVAGLEAFAVSFALGLAAQTVMHWVLLLVAQELLVPWDIVSLGFAAAEAVHMTRRRRSRRDPGTPVVAALFGSVLAIEAFAGYFRAVVPHPDGSLTVQLWPIDWDFHLALVSELARSIPPELPFFAGKPMNYHYLSDVLMLTLGQLGGGRMLDAVAIVEPLVSWLLLIAGALTLVRRLTGSLAAGALAALLVSLVGGTFTVFAGLLLIGPNTVWEHAFHAQPALANFTVNPESGSLGFVLVGLVATHRYRSAGEVRWLFVAALLIAIGSAFKVFTGAVIFAGLGITAAIAIVRSRDFRIAAVTVAAGLCAMPLVLPLVIANAGTGQLDLTVRPAYFTTWALDYMGLTSLGSFVDGVVFGRDVTPFTVLAVAGLTFGVLIGGVGYRLVAVPAMWRALAAKPGQDLLWTTLAWGSAAGTAIMLIFRLEPRDFPDAYNNLGFAYHVSLQFGSLFVAALAVTWVRARRWIAVGLLACTWLFGLVSIGQFLATQAARAPSELTRGEAQALSYVHDRTAVDSVFIVHADPLTGGYPWVERLGGRRVVAGADWAIPHVARAEIESRARDVQRFFATPTDALDVLTRYSIAYVWLTPADPVDGPRWRAALATGRFEIAFAQDGFAVLRIVPGAGAP